MLVIGRCRVRETGRTAFEQAAAEALAVLAKQSGFRRGWVARNADDPDLWLLATEWINTGAYRRALSSYDVKIRAMPVMAYVLDEPSAYEVLSTAGED